MRLLRRHLLRSLTGPFVFSWTALTGMLMLNQLSRRFGDLVGKGLPAGVITEVLVLFIPFIVALTLPMAILVAVLYGFSQLGVDSEITAMRANGVSVVQMLRPVVAAGAILSLANFLFVDQILPRTNLRLLNLQNDIAQKKPTFRLREQVLNDLPGALYFLQASRIEPGSGRMREVVIFDLSPSDGRRVIEADSGYMAIEAGGRNLGLRLFDGLVREYKTAEPAMVRITRFRANQIRVQDIEDSLRKSFGTLEKGDREMTTCEMMDRVTASRRRADHFAARELELARNDVRALLGLVVLPAPADEGKPPAPRCGAWRSVERWTGRLLLPRKAAAQGPVRDSVVAPSPPASPPVGTARPAAAGLASLAELSDVREQKAFYTRDVHQYLVEIHKKYTLSLACLNFVLIGAALALRFPRGGIGLVIGGSLVIFALFYVALTAGETLADDGVISAELAMWLPNLIVLLAGLGGLLRVNREFGSTRGGDLGDLSNLLLGWLPGRGAGAAGRRAARA
jgi:lipopolysaccharide export system permease protein